MKQKVVQWIIDKNRSYEQGLHLLRTISPLDPLLLRPCAPDAQKELLLKLGQALKTNAIPEKQVEQQEEIPQITPNPRHQPTPIPKSNPDPPGLSPVARLSLEISDLKKNIAWQQNQLVKATSDKARKDILFKADRMVDEITYKDKLIKGLESGELDTIPDVEEQKGEDYFEVPETLYELDNKIRRLRSTRSKRAAKIKQMEADEQQKSPEYQQVCTEFEQIDQAIRQLDEHKKVRTKSGN